MVSKETITDYSLERRRPAEPRVLDRGTGNFRVVPFHVVGIVQEFPSAPRDSFMVANLSYLQAADRGGAEHVFARRRPGRPRARVAAATRRAARREEHPPNRSRRPRARSRRST